MPHRRPACRGSIAPRQRGCGYWKHASEGHAFYTTAEDHYNCPVGAHTHGAELPPDRSKELQGLIGTMIELRYLRSDEVPAIPHRAEPLEIAAYAPLVDAPFTPDVVIFRGNARQIMLLTEAARASGAFGEGTVMGRPACAAVSARARVDDEGGQYRLHRQQGLHRACRRRVVSRGAWPFRRADAR